MLGKKIGMTSVYTADGKYVPVTVVKAGPCFVTQIKNKKIDGYSAIQVGFEEIKEKHVTQPLKGHFKKSGDKFFAHTKEFDVQNPDDFSLGQEITLDMFEIGEMVQVTGTSKGRGFAGTIKRHGFGRGPESHGCRNHREPGSIGCSAWPSRVMKGKRMPGHLGSEKRTVRNLQIVDIRPEDNVILIKGQIPGAKSGIVEIKRPLF
jgi:large subunit ribosomal protein L3